MVAGLLMLAISRNGKTALGLYLLVVVVLTFAAVIGNVRRLMVGLVVADTALGLDRSLFLLPNHLGGQLGLEISLTTMILVLFCLLWLAEPRYHPKATRALPGLALSLPTIGIILVSILSILAAKNIQASIFAIVQLIQYLLLYAFVVQIIQSKEDLRFYISALMVVVLVESLMIMFQYFTKSNLYFSVISTNYAADAQDWRPGGTFSTPTSAAAYLAPHVVLILSALMCHPTSLQRWLGMSAVGTGLFALIATQTRAGLLSLILASILLILFALRRGFVKLNTVLPLVFVALLVAVIFSGSIFYRLTTDDAGSAASRIPLNQMAEKMIRAHPLLGVGVNNYSEVMNDYLVLSSTQTFIYIVHNRYLYVWAETGTLGMLCLIWFVAVWLHNAYRAYCLGAPDLAPIALGIVVGGIGTLAIGWNAEALTGRLQEQAIWMMAALATALYGLASQHHYYLARGKIRGATVQKP
jgi:O-antigen ligase